MSATEVRGVRGRRKKSAPYKTTPGVHIPTGSYNHKCPVTGKEIVGSRKFGDYLYELAVSLNGQLSQAKRYEQAWSDLLFGITQLNGTFSPDAVQRLVAALKVRHNLP